MSIETRRPVYDTYQRFIKRLPDLGPQLSNDDEPDTKPGDKGEDAERNAAYTKCGAFLLRQAVSPIDIRNPEGGSILGQDERYISLHLRELSEEKANLGYVRQSLSEVADELTLPEYADVPMIASLTYARMGHAATAFGFEQSELPVQDIAENQDSRAVIVHMPRTDFIEKYSN